MEWSCCSLALRYSLDRWPRYPLARSSTTLRFLWALTARFTRATFRLPGGGLGYLASNFLIFLASAGARTTSPASRLVRRLGLCSNRCLRFARRRITFPVAVSRKRLFAPLCVFIFGMLAVVFLSCAPAARLYPACRPACALRPVVFPLLPRTNCPCSPTRPQQPSPRAAPVPARRPSRWPAPACHRQTR